MLLALGSLAVSVGKLAPAADRVVLLDSGIEFTFATEMERSLKAAKAKLLPFAVELRANAMSVTAMWGTEGDPRTISCTWRDLDARAICVRHD